MIIVPSVLNKYGLNQPKSAIAKNAHEAVNIANSIGYPVALKIESKDILHKTDIGGVCLNVSGDNAVRNAFKNIMDSVTANKHGASIEGISVQEMIPGGIECIIGFNKDPVFGPVLMLGLGGIFTEIIKDVVFRVLPVKKNEAGKMIEELKYSSMLLKGYRGVAPVSKTVLSGVIEKISCMAIELYPEVESFDINPLTMWGDEYRIVDFKYTLSSEISAGLPAKPDTRYIDNFFKAETIAVIGASGTSNKLGNYILHSMKTNGYKGDIFPVNPNHPEIMGIKAYPSLVDVPGEIGLVVLTIPLGGVIEVLEQCRQKNIHNMVIVSAGGKETGNRQLEEDIKKKARQYGVRIIGCNCIGAMDGYTRLDTFFYPEHKVIKPQSGNISMLTQSGTVGVAFLEKITKYGISKFVSYGNRMDVDEGDLIEYLSGDDKTQVIALYVESLENGAKFFSSAKKIAGKKPVVIYKAGRTQQSSNLSKSHTGFLSESYNLSQSVFNQAGITAVDSLEGLVASSKILSRYKKASGNRAMAITNGAGAVIQAMDLIDKNKKIKLGIMQDSFKKSLAANLPGYALIDKIIDLTGSSSDSDYKTAISACYDNKDIDIVMVWIMLQNPFISEDFYRIFEDFIKDGKKPIIAGAAGEEYTREVGARIEGLGLPVFYTVDDWVAAAEAVSK